MMINLKEIEMLTATKNFKNEVLHTSGTTIGKVIKNTYLHIDHLG